MGSLRIGCGVENHVDRSKSVRVPKVLVDAGSKRTWLPAAKLEEIGVREEKKDGIRCGCDFFTGACCRGLRGGIGRRHQELMD